MAEEQSASSWASSGALQNLNQAQEEYVGGSGLGMDISAFR